MLKKFVYILVFVLLFSISSFLVYKSFVKNKKVHYHAGFQVYVDGKLQDFSDIKYMSISPCSDEKTTTPQDEQLEKAHLHDKVGNVVHVHRAGATWNDLFKNLKFETNIRKEVYPYVNGKVVTFDKPIEPYDSLVLFIGHHSTSAIAEALQNHVTKEKIQQVEKKSELCSS